MEKLDMKKDGSDCTCRPLLFVLLSCFYRCDHLGMPVPYVIVVAMATGICLHRFAENAFITFSSSVCALLGNKLFFAPAGPLKILVFPFFRHLYHPLSGGNAPSMKAQNSKLRKGSGFPVFWKMGYVDTAWV
jgi:hypothetical protein